MPRSSSSSGDRPPAPDKGRPRTRPEERQSALSEPMYLILAVLADGPLHGYGILRELEERSEGEHRMLTGTLYNALRRLQAHGLVDAVAAAEAEAVGGGARRTKTYRITAAGLRGLRAEAQRMRSLLRWTPGEALAMEEGR